MTEKKVGIGASIVFFFIWGIISIISLYMAIKTYDPLYLTITGINTIILLIFGVFYLFEKFTSRVELIDENLSDNLTSVV